MDAEILREVVQIKWLVAVLVVGVLFLATVRTWLDIRRTGSPREIFRRSFSDRARSLLEDGRASELLKIANDRCVTVPADPYAFWFHAQAAYRLGDTTTALKSIKRVGELQPEWRESYVEPFIRALTPSDAPDLSGLPPLSMSDREPPQPH